MLLPKRECIPSLACFRTFYFFCCKTVKKATSCRHSSLCFECDAVVSVCPLIDGWTMARIKFLPRGGLTDLQRRNRESQTFRAIFVVSGRNGGRARWSLVLFPQGHHNDALNALLNTYLLLLLLLFAALHSSFLQQHVVSLAISTPT
jgi:hypothetical protein